MKDRWWLLPVALLLAAACSKGGGETKTPSALNTNGPPFVLNQSWGTFRLDPRIANDIKTGKKLVFKYVNYDVTSPFFAPTRIGIADAAKQFGVDASMVGPTTGSAQEQASTIETLVTSGVDGLIVVCAGSDVLTPVIDKAMSQGVPVFTSNIDCPNSHRFAFVGQDLVNSGRVAGQQFLNYFQQAHPAGSGKFTVALFGSDPSFDYVRDRVFGFKEAVGKDTDISFIGPFATTFDYNKAFAAVENAFTSHPDLAGIYMVDEEILAGGTYIDRHGLNGKVIAAGFNFNTGIPQLVQKNAIQASVGQFPYTQGYEPVKMLSDFLTTGKLPSCQACDVGADVVNTQNVADRLSSITGPKAQGPFQAPWS